VSRRFIIQQKADRDVDDIAEYLGRRKRSLGRRFILATRQGFRELSRMPGTGEPVEVDRPELAGLRCNPVPGFPNHLIFYRPTKSGIEVVRVLHGARDIEDMLGIDDEGRDEP